MHDPHLTSDGYTNYGLDTLLEGKKQCKVREEGVGDKKGVGQGRKPRGRDPSAPGQASSPAFCLRSDPPTPVSVLEASQVNPTPPPLPFLRPLSDGPAGGAGPARGPRRPPAGLHRPPGLPEGRRPHPRQRGLDHGPGRAGEGALGLFVRVGRGDYLQRGAHVRGPRSPGPACAHTPPLPQHKHSLTHTHTHTHARTHTHTHTHTHKLFPPHASSSCLAAGARTWRTTCGR